MADSAKTAGTLDRASSGGIKGRVIAIDVYHGYIPPGSKELFDYKPFLLANQGEIRLLNYQRLTDELLADVLVLMVASLGHTSAITFSEEDAEAVEEFVTNGGSLVCLGQAWSWVYPNIGNRTVETFPLNVLGNRLGFKITGRNIGGPVLYPTPLTAGVEVISRRDWWPSELLFLPGSKYIPFIKDAQTAVMAAYTRHNKGHVVVLGHEAMLEANPQLLLSLLKFLLPKGSLQPMAAKPEKESAVGSGGGTKSR